MEHNIAFCVMTHNHPDTVDEVLGNTVEMYDRYGIDIYYFDSSENDSTKVLVEDYIKAGAGNLYYIDAKPPIYGMEKELYLLSGMALNKHYDYIMMIKDRSYFDEETINRLHEISQKSYDAILMPPCHWMLDVYPQPETEVYSDMVAFFRDYGVYTTNWEVVLFNYDTMLKNVDWDDFAARYIRNDISPHKQMILLFDELAKLDNPKVRVMREREVNRCESLRSSSEWVNHIFDIWGERWRRSIGMLPECYDAYKPYVKKKETMQPLLFGSIDQLTLYAKKGVITKKTAEQLKDIWEELSDIPYKCLEYIIDGRRDLLINRLMPVWQTMFKEQRFPHAYRMFCTNAWIKEVYGSYVYDTLEKCFAIYKLELARGKEEGIFANVYSAEDAVNKYQTVKYMLRRLEYDVAYDIKDNIIPYFEEQKMTAEFLSYIIRNECADGEKVINCWSQLYKIFEEDSVRR